MIYFMVPERSTSASCYGIRTRSTYRDLIRSMAIPKCFCNSSPCKAMFYSRQPKLHACTNAGSRIRNVKQDPTPSR